MTLLEQHYKHYNVYSKHQSNIFVMHIIEAQKPNDIIMFTRYIVMYIIKAQKL